jgi:hypothetical protein
MNSGVRPRNSPDGPANPTRQDFPCPCNPLVAAFVVDLPLGEEPLAVGFDEFVLIVAEAVEDAATVRVVVGVVKPI